MANLIRTYVEFYLFIFDSSQLDVFFIINKAFLFNHNT
jgi:hypothetical protein